VKLEIGPPQQELVHGNSKPLDRVRNGNAVFPGGDLGVKPPLRGQLKMAAAVLHAQKKGEGSMGQVHGRPVIQTFVTARPCQRVFD